jgi:hypothetical protein
MAQLPFARLHDRSECEWAILGNATRPASIHKQLHLDEFGIIHLVNSGH